MTTPNDPLYALQWHFNLIGNIQAIWDNYDGLGITVGVYDEGVDYNHDDLAANYDSSLHVVDVSGEAVDPYPIGDWNAHGTACAGIIGAANNDLGGVGVAYGVTLTGVNIDFENTGLYGSVNGQIEPFLDVIGQASGNFDVTSHSWGASPGYYSGLLDGGFGTLVSTAYGTLMEEGRNGLGTSVVQAAGNDNLDGNGDGLNASRYTISVAATEYTGFAAWYSNFGACILVAAPAAAVTTDISSHAGYDDTDYTYSFNGTSAATPVVSGVIALMLQANTELGWRDVQNILAASASLTGSEFDAIQADAEEDGFWYSNANTNWNGGGNHVHTNYGYGMVNVYNAVRMAEVWDLFGVAQTSVNEQSTASEVNSFEGTVVPDGSQEGFTTTFTIESNIQIEHLALNLDFETGWVGDVRIVMTSAAGTEFVVAESSDLDTEVNGTWVFGIDALRGELSAGTWTMTVYDTFSDDVLTVNSASLEVFGSTQSVDDVYHFTDEYATMIGFDGMRGTISDEDGGDDWLNMAAVSGDVVLNMTSGQTFSFDGVVLGELSGSFENIVTGDGNDLITGTDLANEIRGMRGDDTLAGGAGNDSLTGGSGNDTFTVGSGTDAITDLSGSDVLTVAGAAIASATVSAAWTATNGTTNAGTANLTSAGFAVNLSGVTGGSVGFTVTNSAATGATLTGSKFSDTLSGGAGADTLIGGDGNDSLIGGTGNDTYVVDSLDDSVTESSAEGTDTVQSSVTYIIGANIENLTLVGSVAVNGTGNSVDNVLLGNSAVNVLDGGLGNDSLTGGAGNDTFTVAAGVDTVIDLSGSDILTVASGATANATVTAMWTATAASSNIGAANLTSSGYGIDLSAITTGTAGFQVTNTGGAAILTGSSLEDTLMGGSGNDTLAGGAGNDVLAGGAGTDTVTYANATAGVTVSLAVTAAQATGGAGTDTLATIENLKGSGYADTLTGGTTANTIDGGAGNDTITGAAGADTQLGGEGNDLFVVGLAADLATGEVITGGNGTDELRFITTVASTLTLISGVAVESVVIGTGTDAEAVSTGTTAINVSAAALTSAVTLVGNAGINTLTGGSGGDSLEGGSGNDILVGGAGADTLDGGAGNDVLSGGVGTDTASYASATAGVTVSLAVTAAQATGGAGTDTLATIENLLGSGFADTVTGGTTANKIDGGAGNDTVTGAAGVDSLLGGEGNDLFIVGVIADFATGEVITGGNGTDELRFTSTVASTLILTSGVSVENVVIGTGTGASAIASGTTALSVNAAALSTDVTITGNAGANTLTGGTGADSLNGGGGNDVLVGGAGADTLTGGLGNDTFTAASGTDTITDLGAGDILTVAASSTASATVTAAWTATTGTTNAGTATLTTNGFAVNLAAVTGGTLGYNVTNTGVATTLTGSKFADTLTGGTGADTLVGGAGADSLVGGDGNDLFVVALAAQLATGEVITGGNGTDELRFITTVASTLTLISGVAVESVVIGTGTVGPALRTATTAINVNAALAANGLSILGNAGINTLTGSGYNDSLDGGAGNDILVGGAGADTLVGGLGNDNLTGGLGADVFVFNTAPNASTNKDTIKDFSATDDDIWLAKSVMAGLGSVTGALGADAFWGGVGISASQDGTDRVIYNQTTGALYYDADGTGATASIQIGQLTAGTILTASDVFVF